VYFKRHHDDEIVDDVRIVCVPRYKTSGLSGDEWRVSYRMTLSRKGTKLYERYYNSLSDAISHLPWVRRTMFEEPAEGVPEDAWPQRIERDRITCHQPGCAEFATVVYRLKAEYASDGEGPLPEAGIEHRVAFCARHSTRGNCGREDSDANYELVSGSAMPVPASDVRANIFGGEVDLTDDDDDDDVSIETFSKLTKAEKVEFLYERYGIPKGQARSKNAAGLIEIYEDCARDAERHAVIARPASKPPGT